jgi:hypothetical protein
VTPVHPGNFYFGAAPNQSNFMAPLLIIFMPKAYPMKRLLAITILFPIFLSAQTPHGFIIKSLVIQDALHQNPNIIVEKILNNRYSVELAAALRNGTWYWQGGKGSIFPTFRECTGFSVGIAARYYLSEKKSPNAWYTSGLLRYSETHIKQASLYTAGSNGGQRKVNLSRSGSELGLVFGRQFLIAKHITTEVYIGAGTYLQFSKEDYVSGPLDEVIPEQVNFKFRPYLGWTAGYFFGKK